MKMIDMHCHILPGVDDGARTISMSMEMIRQAYNDGIRAIVFTPHFHMRRGVAEASQIIRVFKKTREIAKSKFPKMQFFLGHEIYYTFETIEKLNKRELLSINGSKYVLLEFPEMVMYEHIRDAVSEMYQGGYVPIIAHVERYDEIVKNPNRVKELIKLGAYIQINADTITAGLLDPQRKFAMELLKNNEVHFVGSDAHETKERTPELSHAAKIIQKKFGDERAQKIFWNNPKLVIKNSEL